MPTLCLRPHARHCKYFYFHRPTTYLQLSSLNMQLTKDIWPRLGYATMQSKSERFLEALEWGPRRQGPQRSDIKFCVLLAGSCDATLYPATVPIDPKIIKTTSCCGPNSLLQPFRGRSVSTSCYIESGACRKG